jgi:Tfp pilus assembly protein PilF
MNQEITDVIPKDLTALVEQGVKLRQEGKTAEALKVYQQAAAMPGAPGAVLFNLGNALMDSGLVVEARQAFEEALQRDPTMEPAALQLARCAVRMNDPKLARDLFAQILKANPNPQVWRRLNRQAPGRVPVQINPLRRKTPDHL